MEPWWTDDPITAPADDSLGRGTFVQQVVATMQQVGRHHSSTVVGLTGPWGSGKTSTANLVLAALKARGWGVATLNPWAVGATEAIVAELLGAVGAALPADAKKAHGRLAAYSEYALPLLSLVPYVGGPLQKLGELTRKRLRGEDTLQSRFVAVEQELAKLDQPALVFVDDVDRLQADQLLALFRAVRVLGRLPNVHYLVAYDQVTLLDLLTATPVANGGQDRALAFLEKIVTIGVAQPTIRPEQSARLFNEGLTALLTDLGVSLGEEERRRLRDEWESLLAADLVEPRGIRRFLAQLRVYLPLVGVDEVDLVDFLVITHLRSAYPVVYDAVRADRILLAAPVAYVDDDRLIGWREGQRLGALGLTDEQQERLQAAVWRLFSALRGSEVRQRGVADADYVNRYFTFLPAAADLTDADLRLGLQAWAESDELSPPDALRPALLPSGEPDRLALSAGTIRRLDALTEQLGEAACNRLLPKVLALPPLPSGADLVGGPDAAMGKWVSRLLLGATDIDVEAVLPYFDQPIAATIPLLRALAAAHDDHRFGQLDEPRRLRLQDLSFHSGQLAFRRFRDNVRLGDEAPVDPLRTLFVLTGQLLGVQELNQQLRIEVDAGTRIDGIGARLVDAGIDPASGQTEILDFDAAGLIERLGHPRPTQARSALQAATEEPEAADDTVWAARRRYAARRLVEAIDAITGRSRSLPSLPADVAQPFLNHHVDVVNAPADRPANLTVSITALVPAAQIMPSATREAPGPQGGDRERLIIDELEHGRLSLWLNDLAVPAWSLTRAPWTIDDPGDGRRYTRLRSDLTHAPASPQESELAVRAGAEIRTAAGDPDGEPFLVADFAVALWRKDRSLADLYSLLIAVIGVGAASSVRLYGRLIGRPDPLPRVVVRVTLAASAGIQSVVDLSHLDRAGADGVRATQQTAHFEFANPSSYPGFDRDVNQRTLAVLNEWLMRSGYRGYEDLLLQSQYRVPDGNNDGQTTPER